MSVRGVTGGWWTIAPATAYYLLPYGSDRTYEQGVQIYLHPPRTPQAPPRHNVA